MGTAVKQITTTQSDWSSGTLTDVVATAAGDLELAQWDALMAFRFEGNWLDEYGRYNGTAYGGIGFVGDGKRGAAARFDGADDYVDTGFTGATPDGWTVCAWIRLPTPTDATARFHNIVGKGQPQTSVRQIHFYAHRNASNVWDFLHISSSHDGVTGYVGSAWAPAGGLPVGQWIFVCGAAQKVGSTWHHIYWYNGQRVYDWDSGVTAPLSSNTAPLEIGRADNLFWGDMDEVMIFARPLTDQEVLELYNRGYAGKYRSSSGTRTSPILDLSPVGIAAGSSISWNATTPAGTSVTVETNLSLDGGATWQGWQQATNGGPIPGITPGTDLSNARLQTRQTLSTTDTTVTPQLHDLTVSVGSQGRRSAPVPVEVGLSSARSVPVPVTVDVLGATRQEPAVVDVGLADTRTAPVVVEAGVSRQALAPLLVEISLLAARLTRGGALYINELYLAGRRQPQVLAGLEAERPLPGVPGRLYVATDTLSLYRDTGTAWVKVAGMDVDTVDGKHGNDTANNLAVYDANRRVYDSNRLDGMQPSTSATANTIAQRDSSGNLTANQLVSTVATGTPPLVVSSSTTVQNLSADMVDGYHAGQAPLDTADVFTQTVRCADFRIGFSGRRGSPGRALVDSGSQLVINYGPDWSGGTVVHGVLYPGRLVLPVGADLWA